MLNRIDRNDTAILYEAFFNGKIYDSSDEVDTLIQETCSRVENSDDPTVQMAYKIFIQHHEACGGEIHLIDKSEWDYLERIRLVLLSDAELLEHSQPINFNRQNLLSLLASTSFFLFWYLSGTGWHLLLYTVPLGLLLFLTQEVFTDKIPKLNLYQGIIEPFISLQQLEKTYHSVSNFQKNKFPAKYRNKKSWSWTSFEGNLIILIMLIFSPLILLIMSIPDSNTQYTVSA